VTVVGLDLNAYLGIDFKFMYVWKCRCHIDAFKSSGILIVEENARFCRDLARTTGFFEEYRIPFWNLEENVEMVTRSMVRDGFSDLKGAKVSSVDWEALEGVLFDIIYPC
jgi:hypothetical protein